MISSSSTQSVDGSVGSFAASLPESSHKKIAEKIVSIIPGILKPGNFIPRNECVNSLVQYKKSNPTVIINDIEVKADNGLLTAHKVLLASELKSNVPHNRKKAIIYVCGNGEHVSDMIPLRQQLLTDISKQSKNTNKTTDITLFMQDYRGRGINQKDEKENFNQYSLEQDAKDIACLIKKIVTDGYAYENITILGHSLGSAVTLWAIDLLTQENEKFKDMNVVSDRGYGDPEHILFLQHLKKIDETLKKDLQDKGMMPKKPLAEIAAALPNLLALMARGDGVIPEKLQAGLVSTLRKSPFNEKLIGHTFTVETTDSKQDAHNVGYQGLRLTSIPEIQPHTLLTAMIHKEPIKIRFAPKLPPSKILVMLNFDEITQDISQALKYGWILKTGEVKETIACPSLPLVLNNSSVTITTDVATQLLDHCNKLAAEALKSTQGKNYINSRLGFLAPLFYWTTGAVIEKACEILQLLCQPEGPHVESLEKLNEQPGPQQSDKLRVIMDNVMMALKEYKEIQKFNAWVKPTPVPIVMVDSTPEMKQIAMPMKV